MMHHDMMYETLGFDKLQYVIGCYSIFQIREGADLAYLQMAV